MTALLEAREVSHAFGTRKVLDDVTLALEAGEVLVTLGPNAAGKTTLLRILSGILRPQSGEVWLGSRPLARCNRREIARSIAVVPQEFATAFPFDVAATVALGRAPHLGTLGTDSPRDHEICRKALETFALTGLASQSFATLSGGEKQRVLLARAVAQDCEILLLDEPTAHMDLGHRLRTLEWLREWVGQAPTTRAAMLISHDLVLSARFADRVALLAGGRLAARGTSAEVLTAERIRSVYGVEADVIAAPDGSVTITPRESRIGFGFGYSPDRHDSD